MVILFHPLSKEIPLMGIATETVEQDQGGSHLVTPIQIVKILAIGYNPFILGLQYLHLLAVFLDSKRKA